MKSWKNPKAIAIGYLGIYPWNFEGGQTAHRPNKTDVKKKKKAWQDCPEKE